MPEVHSCTSDIL